MINSTTTQTVLFEDVADKPVVARFDQEHSSSDGGALLLKAADQRLGLSRRLGSCLVDKRQQGKVLHSNQQLWAQRLFGIACGCADGNDAARLSDDPIFKLLSGRDPVCGDALASQPTLSRFENGARAGELLRMSEALAQVVIDRHRKLAESGDRIVIMGARDDTLSTFVKSVFERLK